MQTEFALALKQQLEYAFKINFEKYLFLKLHVIFTFILKECVT